MTVATVIRKLTLPIVLTTFLAGIIESPALAGARNVKRGKDSKTQFCLKKENRNKKRCDRQALGSGDYANKEELTIDFAGVSPSLLVDVAGSSTDPEDIVRLVNDAVSVWEAAFVEESLPDVTLHVGWADFGTMAIAAENGLLPGELVGDAPNQEVFTELFSVAADVVGLHICGAPGELFEGLEDCAAAGIKDATILFNSEALRVKDNRGSGKPESTIKYFLDSNPFESEVFGPLSELGGPNSNYAGPKSDFSDPYVIDLFTVALHEVGHALGYSVANDKVTTQAAHVSNIDIPDVMSAYIPFSYRKCLSERDILAVRDAGSYLTGQPDYELADPENPNSCDNELVRPPFSPTSESTLVRWPLIILLVLLTCGISAVVINHKIRSSQK